jgi:hypothetical protein
MPMPYRQSGLIEALARHRAANEAEVSAAGSPVDFLKITREIARSTNLATSSGKFVITDPSPSQRPSHRSALAPPPLP